MPDIGDDSVLTSLFPDEVVTRALVRDVQLPSGAGTMALITLDNGHDHTRPNTFGPGGLISLREALDLVVPRADRGDIAAVGVTGKPFIFAVGADLTGAALVGSRDEALAIGRLGHAVFRRLGELGVPSFAFVNGAALGGGLELALHCSYRTISSGVTAVAFPECFLGLLPGWGGTYLLPHLIGPANALKVIVENPLSQNRMLRGAQALSLGIADAMFEPADSLAESLRWAALLVRGDDPPRPPRSWGDPSPQTPLGGDDPPRPPLVGGAGGGNLTEPVGIEVPTRLLIGGEWTGGRGGGTLSVINPATEDALAEVADGTVEDALDAVGAASGALPGWGATPPRQRAECLRRTFELMTSHAESLARLMAAENGKALRDARAEAAYAAEFFRWYAEEAVRMEGVLMQAPSGANKILVMRQPV